MGYSVVMDGPAREPSIASIVTTIAERSEPETERLAAMLRSWCWPGGAADRREPGALEWVRRWGPSRLTAEPLDCSCAGGRCAVCN
jgi:hypothetical protein